MNAITTEAETMTDETIDRPESAGHVCWIGEYEYFHDAAGHLYAAHQSGPMDVNGYRMGARFECMPRADNHAAHLAIIRAAVALD